LGSAFGRIVRYHALAADYDGTLAHHGLIDDLTWSSLKQLRDSGRKLIMVTGRELDELKTVCSRLDMFDLVVAENGALLYEPSSGEEVLISAPPSEDLVGRLKEANVPGLSVGRSIVATWEPYETVVLEAIRELGLELQIIFNKGAVMVLPSTVNKASGLAAALKRLKIKPECIVGVGDAENDHAFIKACGCGVAVANAIPSLKDEVDIVLGKPRGEGVVELADRIIATDLADVLAARAAPVEPEGYDEERSFWFRGPESKLKLRAQSLALFLQIGDGVDDETWLFHLRNGDFARWFAAVVGDARLAERARRAADDQSLDAAATREAIRAAIGTVNDKAKQAA